MPQIVDYPIVAQRLTGQGLVSLYHNSGAFGFPADAVVQTVGWMGPVDPTIRSEMRALVRQVAEPHHQNLARMLIQVWQAHLAGEIWLMPKSHWHYELHFGNRELLEKVLQMIAIDPAELRERNDGSAIEFSTDERASFETAARELVGQLRFSDFLLAFPGRPALCTVHHHEQLWWQTTDQAITAALRA